MRKAGEYIRALKPPQEPSIAITTAIAPDTAPPHPDNPRPSVVLDTNVVLDWLLFADARALALGRAIVAGELRWTVSPAIVAEYERVFKPSLARTWGVDGAALSQACAQWATVTDRALPFCGLRCTDPDDQVFIDLALATGSRWLVTRDKALLKLRRRALDRGLQVLRPVDWAARLDPSANLGSNRP